ncbi:RES family NAD+ phosphorylase [Salinimicrobium soli]|uniref:RES family NAD+ phosphorylase n=1 Tax=Salinimicrobium soli TaxID=1254399 RepID=UPI003AAF4E1B
MKVYRLSRRKHAETLSGKGAAIVGGRWNSKGTEIIYTAQSRALALAEVAVHLSLATLPTDFVMVEIEIPDELEIEKIAAEDFPARWNAFPYNLQTQHFGDDFSSTSKKAILRVPSAVVPGDFNYLINPRHQDFSKIRILGTEQFLLDNRLFK